MGTQRRHGSAGSSPSGQINIISTRVGLFLAKSSATAP